MGIKKTFFIGGMTVALSTFCFHTHASAFSLLNVTMDSLATPVFSNEKLNAGVYDYVKTLDNYYNDIRNNQANALSILQIKLETINEKIMLEATLLSDEDLDKLQIYLDAYGRLIEKKVNQHFLDEIAALEAEMQLYKEANEKAVITTEQTTE